MASSYANRGQGLEELINWSNRQYAAKRIAVIQKVPTPVKVVRQGTKIVSAFFSEPSTVDYVGIYQSKAIAFDAKETGVSTRFDLALVSDHQYEFLKRWQEIGGTAFILVHFTAIDAHYILPFELLDEAWRGAHGGRKSIPIAEIVEKARGIGPSRRAVLDYLAAV